MESLRWKYRDLGQSIADSLPIFSLDVVGIIGSYLCFLPPQTPGARKNISRLLAATDSNCFTIAIDNEHDVLWRASLFGLALFDLNGSELSLRPELCGMVAHDFLLVKNRIVLRSAYDVIFFNANTYNIERKISYDDHFNIAASESSVFVTNVQGWLLQIGIDTGAVIKRYYVPDITSVTCDCNGRPWIVNSRRRIVSLDTATGEICPFKELEYLVFKIRVDFFGNVYVIHVLDQDKYISIYGTNGDLIADLLCPFAVDVNFDRFNRIYAADVNGNVQCFGFVKES